jgi:hypothetical protein
VALEGSLKDFGLADILQLIFQRKTGVLTLESRLDKVLLVIDGTSSVQNRRRIEANRLGSVRKGLSLKRPQTVLDNRKLRTSGWEPPCTERIVRRKIEEILVG